MSTAPHTSLGRRVRTAASRVPNPLPRWVSIPAKFLLCGTIGQVAWVVLMTHLGVFDGPTATEVQTTALTPVQLGFTASVTLPALGAAVVYERLPSETVDVFHRFGKGSALFFVLNIFASGGIVATMWHTNGLNVQQAFGYWAIASLFLPGLYVGCLVAARWAR